MIKILFSPSEGKHKSQEFQQISQNVYEDSENLPCLNMQAVKSYLKFLNTRSENEIAKIFGSQTLNPKELELVQNLLSSPRIESIRLYNGVAYGALDFESLDSQSQDYLFKNLYIFSNLFGPVRADDRIPYYNLHQGKGVGDFELKTLYRCIAPALDELFADIQVLDLRAEAYVKAYMPHVSNPAHYYQVHFFKNAKKVSHYAKFYRGAYARSIALSKIENLDELESLYIDGLRLKGRTSVRNVTILTYEVCEH